MLPKRFRTGVKNVAQKTNAAFEVPGGIHQRRDEAPLSLQLNKENIFHQRLAFVTRHARVIPQHFSELLSGGSIGEKAQNIVQARFAYVFVQFIGSRFVIRLLNNSLRRHYRAMGSLMPHCPNPSDEGHVLGFFKRRV